MTKGTSADQPDPHQGPVPTAAWEADDRARARGRVEMFNATRPNGLDGWTISLEQYALLRRCILDTIAAFADGDGSVLLSVLVARVMGSSPQRVRATVLGSE